MNTALSKACARPGRNLALAVGVALLAAAVLAPSLGAVDQEYWAGKWKTENKFGTPTLLLSQEGKKVEGRYKDKDEDGGRLVGTINGKTDKTGLVWEGGYAGDDGSSGSFTVHIEDGKSFKGHFEPYGSGDKHKWTGECVRRCTGF